MNIPEYDLRLYELLRRCLQGDYVSPLRDALTPAMRAGMLRTLRTTDVGTLCGCGDDFCRSFSTATAPPTSEELFTIRFNVDGELHVTCDGLGTIYGVQWLRAQTRAGGTLRCYALTTEAWSEHRIADVVESRRAPRKT